MVDWIPALALVFGGCCSNAITTEWLTADDPRSGILITFFQFLVAALYTLPSQLTFHHGLPRLRQRRVPLSPYLLQVALFLLISVLNNAAFAYDIPMSVHIVFRSGGMIINMLLGWLLVDKRYALKQILSVLIVTIGILLTTLSAPTPHTHTAVSLYPQGIAILALALFLSGFLGLTQDYVFARYIKPTETPHAQPHWQETMFYNHALALPLFYVARERIATVIVRSSASPVVSLAPIPRTLAYFAVNTVTQLLCVLGVNRITGRVSSLTVTLVLTVRKAVSLLLSVAVYGGQGNAIMWSGAALVFIGTIGYATGTRTRAKAKED